MKDINNVSPKIIINSYYNSLAKTEKIIASYVLKNFEQTKNMQVNQIAETLDVSESSVLRFIKKLGYEGFKEFKFYCSIFEESNPSNKPFDEFSPEINELKPILEANIRSNINNLKIISDFIDYDVLEAIIQLFISYRKIYIVGNGYSSMIARYLYHLLFTAKKEINLSTEAFDTQQFTYKVDKDSFVFFISQKGNNSDDLHFANFAKKKGATTACLTRIANNPLSELVDHPLIVNSLTNKEASNYLLTQISFNVIINTIFMYVSSHLQNEQPDNSS